VNEAVSDYDGLDPEERALARGLWQERMKSYRDALDLVARFREQGRRTWVELDEVGQVVERTL